MNILAFDTCFAACSAAAGTWRDNAGQDAQSVNALFEPMATGHAERLVSMIAEVTRSAGLALADLDRIAVTNGPGSFTGTRIAVAAARALMLARPRQLIVASSLSVMAEQAARALSSQLHEARNSGPHPAHLAIAVDARRGEVYVQLFLTGGADPVIGPLLLPVEEAARLGGAGPLLVAGSAAVDVANAAERQGRPAAAYLPELLPDARDLWRLAGRQAPSSGPLRPLYLRPADAKPQTGKSIERALS